MVYDRVEGLAREVSAGADALETGTAAFPLALPAAAFGNTDSAGECTDAFLGAGTSAATAAGHLLTTLRADVVKLADVVDCFKAADHAAADMIYLDGLNKLDVFTAHVHSRGSYKRGDANDRERARQINKAVDQALESPAPTVFTGDLNETVTNDRDGADAISRLPDGHGFTDAAEAAGPTSSEGKGKRIDYIFASADLGTGRPKLVDGGPSDHHGVAADVSVPRSW